MQHDNYDNHDDEFDRIRAIPEIDCLLKYVNMLPSNPVIVEIGSYLGGTTARIAKARPDARIITCDPCLGVVHGREDSNWTEPYNEYTQKWIVDTLKMTPSKELLEANLSRFPNVEFVHGFSPLCFSDWDGEVDLYFEDGSHGNPALRVNLNFWKEYVKVGGYLAAHDYESRCPDVITEIDEIVASDEWSMIEAYKRPEDWAHGVIAILQKTQ